LSLLSGTVKKANYSSIISADITDSIVFLRHNSTRWGIDGLAETFKFYADFRMNPGGGFVDRQKRFLCQQAAGIFMFPFASVADCSTLNAYHLTGRSGSSHWGVAKR
jgi:hypothetical protein